MVVLNNLVTSGKAVQCNILALEKRILIWGGAQLFKYQTRDSVAFVYADFVSDVTKQRICVLDINVKFYNGFRKMTGKKNLSGR